MRFDDVALPRQGVTFRADVTLPAGRSVALIGPSGAGKSTALALIAGFERPASGRILLEQHDVAGQAPADRPVTMLFQDNNLFPHLTLMQNAALGLRPTARLSAAEQAQVAQSLAAVGLDGLATARPGQLSGGQQSRAALARALLRARPILLLDEPFAALGPAQRLQMFTLVEDIRRAHAMTLVLVTHDPAEAARADMICFVEGGILYPPRPSGDLLADPPPGLREYLG
ncbi:MAG: ATP-binding cassette domain-containing protein [Pseudomonadota bacterium]